MEKQLELFIERPRDSRGRFATLERAYADRAMRQNAYLKHEVEKYKRMWMAAADSFAQAARELKELKERIKALQ